MATKKMKKFKRYEEGGEVTVDEPKTRRISFNPDGSRTQSFAEQIASRQQTGGDQAAFKKSGLEASNKEKPVGFFERLRMGNIDEVGTEAYNRLGAGRGRTSAPVPAINQVAPRKVSIGDEAYENERAKRRAMARSFDMQQDISAGTDFVDRPQDEGYRPYISPRDRAIAEGAKDEGKITESGNQGFGGPGSSRVVKAMPTAMPKAAPKPAAAPEKTYPDKNDPVKTQTLLAEKQKPAAETVKPKSNKVPTSEQAAANRSVAMDKIKGVGSSISDYFSGLKSPSQRKAQERKMEKLKADPSSRERDLAKGGKVSASNRGDGIAQRGKTRGKMC